MAGRLAPRPDGGRDPCPGSAARPSRYWPKRLRTAAAGARERMELKRFRRRCPCRPHSIRSSISAAAPRRAGENQWHGSRLDPVHGPPRLAAGQRVRSGALNRQLPRLSPGSLPEPARPPHGTELLLLGGVLERRLVALGRRRVAVQEVHLDLADEPAAKLGVADPRSAERRRRLTARDRGRDVVGDDDRGRLGEDPGLGDGSGAGADVADRVDAGELGLEIRLVDWDPAVDREAGGREWIGRAVLRDADEQVVGERLAARELAVRVGGSIPVTRC